LEQKSKRSGTGKILRAQSERTERYAQIKAQQKSLISKVSVLQLEPSDLLKSTCLKTNRCSMSTKRKHTEEPAENITVKKRKIAQCPIHYLHTTTRMCPNKCEAHKNHAGRFDACKNAEIKRTLNSKYPTNNTRRQHFIDRIRKIFTSSTDTQKCYTDVMQMLNDEQEQTNETVPESGGYDNFLVVQKSESTNTNANRILLGGEAQEDVEFDMMWKDGVIKVTRKYKYLKPIINFDLFDTLQEKEPYLLGFRQKMNESQVESQVYPLITAMNKIEDAMMENDNVKALYDSDRLLLGTLERYGDEMELTEQTLSRSVDRLSEQLKNICGEIERIQKEGTSYVNTDIALLRKLQIQEQIIRDKIQRYNETLDSIHKLHMQDKIDEKLVNMWVEEEKLKLQQTELVMKPAFHKERQTLLHPR
jgi:hypothetical protein